MITQSVSFKFIQKRPRQLKRLGAAFLFLFSIGNLRSASTQKSLADGIDVSDENDFLSDFLRIRISSGKICCPYSLNIALKIRRFHKFSFSFINKAFLLRKIQYTRDRVSLFLGLYGSEVPYVYCVCIFLLYYRRGMQREETCR